MSEPIICHAVAVEIIRTIRAQAGPEPCLRLGNGRRTSEGSKRADAEHGRKRVERELLEVLSRYYPVELSEGKSWGRPLLLLNGKHVHGPNHPNTLATFHSHELLPVLRDLKDLTELPDQEDLENTGA